MTSTPSESGTADRLPLRLLARVWLPFACGYFMSYFFRVINAMIAAGGLGALAASTPVEALLRHARGDE